MIEPNRIGPGIVPKPFIKNCLRPRTIVFISFEFTDPIVTFRYGKNNKAFRSINKKIQAYEITKRILQDEVGHKPSVK